MTPEGEALAAVLRALDAAGIPYMITGSVASSHHGRPRSSQDTDVVIDPSPEALRALTSQLTEQGFYVDPDRAQDSLRRRRMFNVIEMGGASKVDLIIRKARAFSLEEFERRQPVEVVRGLVAPMATAEDTVVAKLEWAREWGESEKQLGDVRGILDVCAGHLDIEYIERWVRELGLVDQWRRVHPEPERFPPAPGGGSLER